MPTAVVDSIVQVLVERIKELQEIVSNYEKAFPQLAALHDHNQSNARVNATLGIDALPVDSELQNAMRTGETISVREATVLREENTKLKAENMRLTSERVALTGENKILLAKLKDMEQRLLSLSETNSRLKHQIGKLVDKQTRMQHALPAQKRQPKTTLTVGGIEMEEEVVNWLKEMYLTLLEEGEIPEPPGLAERWQQEQHAAQAHASIGAPLEETLSVSRPKIHSPTKSVASTHSAGSTGSLPVGPKVPTSFSQFVANKKAPTQK
eukprot:TRINITY_DN54999_c0_g1_i1.p1 TRINITY_DN54999_c0_g1~~TRINITY_DN54999_c0_g1_i1.p1  ORF type:complete len:267 (+),score=30.37 TRINITY_DN54999_c0_g1_i1:37-837(+)